MARVATPALYQHLGTLFDSGSLIGLTDRQLLERFNARRDHTDSQAEAAFAALVHRHGPMVYNVCRQILEDPHLAEDAFQAVFLVLARRARSIRDPEKLSNWLYGTALRTARCLKPRLDRQRQRENGDLTNHPSTPSAEQLTLNREQARILHDEIARLPRDFRLAIVLHHLQGLSLEQAAAQLACPHGTLCSRLARAREKLKHRLTRRGVSLSTMALNPMLSSQSASDQLSRSFVHSTAQAALQFAAGKTKISTVLNTTAIATATQVLRALTFVKTVKVAAFALIALGSAGLGATQLGPPRATHTDEAAKPTAAPAHKTPQAPRPTNKSPERMMVTARVLAPTGKPIIGAAFDLVASPRQVNMDLSNYDNQLSLLNQGQTDAGGRVQLETARISMANHYSVFAVASAPGYGIGWVNLNADLDQPTAEIQLSPEQPIPFRLVDIRGLPAAGVEVIIHRITRRKAGSLPNTTTLSPKLPDGSHTWPPSVKTDAQGRATFHGVGQDINLVVDINDSRYAHQSFDIQSSQISDGKERTIAIQPAKQIEGHVLAGDTGLPIPGAIVYIGASASARQAGGIRTTRFQADALGHFTANAAPGDYFRVIARAPEGQPYLDSTVEFSWDKAAIRKQLDISISRAVLIRGKVTEQGAGHGLAGASVQAFQTRAGGYPGPLVVASKADGSFEIPVHPGKGHLLIFGPTGDYVLSEIGSRELYAKPRPGGLRLHGHAIIAYETKPGAPPLEINAELRPGVTIKGRVQGPQGEPVNEAQLITPLYFDPRNPRWHNIQPQVRDSRFELHGIDPEGFARFHVFDSEHEWGTTLEVSRKSSADPITVRLEPCGQARARFVGPDGKSLPNVEIWQGFFLVVTPGPNFNSRNNDDPSKLAADEEYLINLDPNHHNRGQRTDGNGSIILPALIPGATYRFNDFTTANTSTGTETRRDFRVKSGEMLNLGDILIKKPPL